MAATDVYMQDHKAWREIFLKAGLGISNSNQRPGGTTEQGSAVPTALAPNYLRLDPS